MRPAWRLGISSLSGRRSRTALLVCAVALSAALIAAVSCSMSSVHASLRARVESMVGASDLRVAKVGKDLFDIALLQVFESRPETRVAVPRLRDALTLENPRAGKRAGTQGNGVELSREFLVRPLTLIEGRALDAEGEIVIDQRAAEVLDARLGDRLIARAGAAPIDTSTNAGKMIERVRGMLGDALSKPGAPKAQPAEVSFTLVGITKQPAIGMGIIVRPESIVTRSALSAITGRGDKISEIDVILHDPSTGLRLAEELQSQLPMGVLAKPSAKVTSGLDEQISQSQIGMSIASALAYLAASFIIMTGLTTSVNERLRELAMLRCIGASRSQMAESQLVVGLIIGGIGALVGVPLGVLGSFILIKSFPSELPGGFTINALSLLVASAGSVGAGLIGAAWPAIRVARTSPLEALAARAKQPRTTRLILCAVLGVLLAALQLAIVFGLSNADNVFWANILLGLPCMFVGYFLISVPVFVIIARTVGVLLGRLLALPSGLLHKTVLATPYRFGFTSGAMMMGLALLIAIWTNGRAVMEDWLDKLKFPDAFVAGVSISDQARERIEALPFVTGTVAIQTLTMKTTAFGLETFDHTGTTFIAFEPEPFFRMTSLEWIEGTPQSAIPLLEKGGAVLVAKEFQTARGVHVGDSITLTYEDQPYTFTVAGVVSSPGLDIVNSWFEIGEDYAEQAVNSVFGSRDDMKRLFGVESTRLLQVGLADEFQGKPLNDAHAIQAIKDVAGAGIIDAGSGRQILAEVKTFLSGSLAIFSLVAIGAMLIACFGVANLIIAGIQARQFEFGVLRAVGAQQALLARLVLGEAILIALCACVMGTAMGVHGVIDGQRMSQLLVGMTFRAWPHVAPTLAGWGVVLLITVGAATPAILSLNKKKVRELIGGMKG